MTLNDLSLNRLITSLSFLTLFVCVSHAVASDVEITTLEGKSVTGELVKLDAQQVTVRSGDAVSLVSTNRLMSIAWPTHEPVPADDEPSQQVLLVDGSKLIGNAATSDGLNLTLNSRGLGDVSVSMRKVKATRFQPLDEQTSEQWNMLIDKPSSDDRLVINKQNVLDFLAGVVAEFDTKEVRFLYQGSEIPVNLSKVFGIVHPGEMQANPDAVCAIKTIFGDSFYVTSLSIDEGVLKASTGPQLSISVPIENVAELDFSLGRIVYLSELEPEGTEYTPFFDTIWEFQRNRTIDGSPLQIGKKKYSKGLWIHSKTVLTYRLAGEFGRFQGIAGIDYGVASRGHGNVKLTISADEQPLLSRSVAAADGAIPFDLDVTGKRFLKIKVDFGKALDIGDHLDIVEAKLIK